MRKYESFISSANKRLRPGSRNSTKNRPRGVETNFPQYPQKLRKNADAWALVLNFL
jgi:hypothetical protein